MDSQEQDLRHHAVAQLAPEIIFHILSFLHDRHSPAGLLPILTLCKSWARLALELLYKQPVVSLAKIGALVATLNLQDRLQNGQMPLWDPAWCSSTLPSLETPGKSLGIDYRAMIKEPCRIVGKGAPVKQDLIHIWDLQTLLWTAPAFFKAHTLHSDSCDSQLPPSSSLSPPPSPTSAQSSSVEPSRTPSNGQSLPSHPSPPSSVRDPSEKPPSSGPQRKAYVVRRKKRSLSPTVNTVLLLDVSETFTDTMHQILRQVSGMKLARLHYQWRLDVSLLDLIESNLASLRELHFARSPTRQDELLAMAQLLTRVKHVETITLDDCQGASSTVLAQLARSCGSSLRTLEIRQHVMIRPIVDHSHFPVDGAEDWNQSEPEITRHDDSRLESEAGSLHVGQMCSRCDLGNMKDQECYIESLVKRLSIMESSSPSASDAAAPASPEQGIQTTPADTDLDSRMDLALCEFGSNCVNLSRLRLQHITWLSDESLAGLKPDSEGEHALDYRVRRRRGLEEIELLDSYYGSRVTVEGVLELCGPDLEVLVVDRKSCWRTRPRPRMRIPSGLCAGCSRREAAKQARICNMSTGDRLICGLIQRGQDLDPAGLRAGRVRRLDTLTLIEHWVSISVLMEAMSYWRSTLRKVGLRLFKCSIQVRENEIS